ncbi:hypothetical protein HOY80DRAFT_1032926 [Tuber brumale]|nr:hypothetical protein HOY80DRAFT_1032926 [Tuber brumale]
MLDELDMATKTDSSSSSSSSSKDSSSDETEAESIEKQLLLTLKHLGSYGNSVSLANLAQWRGVHEGMVDKATQRMLKAVIYSKLQYFGERFFDRKSNYSVNVPIINTPDLQIINYSVRFVSSTMDNTAWQDT